MTTTPSNARALYEQIIAAPDRGLSFLQTLVTTEAEENEWMEFKGAHQLDTKEDNVKEIWSKALGAFANSSGGLLIWGINAPQKVANGISLAKDAARLADRLGETLNSVIQPHVPGVLITPVLQDAGPEGFVICFIPESRFAPHQSLFPRREFYIRCQDSSMPTPYAALRRQFQPSLGPILCARFHIQVYKDDAGISVSPDLRIWNAGYSSANELQVRLSGHPIFPKHAQNWEFTSYTDVAGYTKPIHPDQIINIRLNSNRIGGSSWPLDDESFTAEIKLYSRDSRPFEYRFSVSWQSLRLAYESGPQKPILVNGVLAESDG